MHAYLGGIVKELGCKPIRIGGVEDHVHLLTTLSRTLAIADFIKETKRVSSIWGHQRQNTPKAFQWQSGYGVFSVSHSQLEPVIRYIDNQQEHHTRYDFQTELRELFRRHQVEFDERYLWD